MKKLTETEIRRFVENTICAENTKVLMYEDRIEIEVSSMYSAPRLSFQTLMAFAEFMGTRNIDTDGSYQGCYCYDGGGFYGYTLYVRPEAP
jgi:hypothetical protein